MEKLEIPFEVADGITLANLQEQCKTLEEWTEAHERGEENMHPDDYHRNRVELIPAMKVLIEYFGG